MTRHWTDDDFTITATSPAYDGSGAVNRFGYCAKCYADMQSFGGNGKSGPIKHYKSHNNAKKLGLWGKDVLHVPPNYLIALGLASPDPKTWRKP